MSSKQRMLAACKGEPTDRAPVWLMRQAGRYLPEFRALREQHSLREVVKTPALAVEAALLPLRHLPLDAGVVLSDDLVLLDTLGAEVEFTEAGPVVQRRFAGDADVERLRALDPRTACAYLGESAALLASHLHPRDRAVIAVAGSPLTLAAHLVEGRPTRDLRHLKALSYTEPAPLLRLMEALADVVAASLQLQVDAGADVVQISDPWAAQLSPSDYEALALPAVRRIVEQLQGQVPVIYYLRGAASHLDQALTAGADTLAIDPSLDLADARMAVPRSIALQGNLDCAHLFAPPEHIRAEVRDLRRSSRRGVHGGGWVANLGNALVPDAPLDGVAAFVEAVVEGL